MQNSNPEEKSIFLSAIAIESETERLQFLEQACAQDQVLRAGVESLLQAHEQPQRILDQPIVPGTPVHEVADSYEPGAIIGPYELLEKIGEGGFGVVYMAAQQHPVRRKVALKVIKPGMDSRPVIARFEMERQALAMMDHPNVAKVLDAGQTASGRPYFVMDLVKGLPITVYCDQIQLALRDRLSLFVDVCQAVHHAHQKGIVHRDIKPSNVLVTLNDGVPLVKVIDFGIAKALHERLTDKTLFTGFAQILGSPLYMSPEQAAFSNNDVDTRTDIFSLGVLLYELLTGTTPFDKDRLHQAGFDEMRRIIAEEEPPRPSTRLTTLGQAASTICTQRRCDPRRLQHFVRGELDWIVMKALEKDRNRRYETVNALAADIGRYLQNEPVQACPPSAWYRLCKFARRNRVALLAVGLVGLTLVIGTMVSTWQAIRATRAESAAKQEAAIAEAVNEFLNEGLLTQASARQTPDRDLKLRTVLDRTSQRIEGRFADQPLVEARLRMTLASTYESLGEYRIAQQHAERARDLYQRVLGVEHPDTLSAMDGIGKTLTWQARYEVARKLFEEVIALRRRVLGDEHRDTLTSMCNLAGVLREQGQFEEARQLHAQTLEIRCRVLGAEHPDSLVSMAELAVVLFQQERLEEARSLLERAMPAQRRVLGGEHPDTLGSMHTLAHVLVRQGQVEAAAKLYEEALQVQRRVLGTVHSDTIASINNLAWLLATAPDAKLRAPARALELASEIARLKPDEGNSWNTLGTAQYRAGNWAKAISALEKSIALHRGQAEADTGEAYSTFFLAMAHWQLGKEGKTLVEQQAGHRQEARKWYDAAVAWMEKNRPNDEELNRFRAEAAELLGIKEPPPKAK